MNLSQIRAALDSAGVRPAKKLGQNFLHDQNLARWIVEQAQIVPDDFVLEIGPGLGALTSEILKRGAPLGETRKRRLRRPHDAAATSSSRRVPAKNSAHRFYSAARSRFGNCSVYPARRKTDWNFRLRSIWRDREARVFAAAKAIAKTTRRSD